MLKHRIKGLSVLHSICVAAAATTVFWLWAALFFTFFRSADGAVRSSYLECSILLVASIAVNHLISKLHRLDLLQLDFFAALRAAFQQTITVLSVMAIYLFARRDFAMSRLFLFSFIPLFCVCAAILNAKLPRFLASRIFHHRRRQPTILVGSPSQARNITKWLQNKSRYGVDIIGIVTESTETPGDLPWPILGHIKNFDRILSDTGASQVIALGLPNSLPRAARFGMTCEKMGIRVIFINDIEQRFSRSVNFFDDSGIRLVSLREEPLECPFNRILKRVLDIAIALPIVVFVLPPVCLFVHLAHRFQSPGPLFFWQKRSGLQRTPFEIIKFRTMHVANPDESAQATRGDVRVFSIGRWLRRLSIDELPQFINVLRSDMSVVGPRPHMIEHDDVFALSAETYRLRSLVRPGITGLAQVKGFRGEARNAKDVIDRVHSDVYYLENWSLGLDGAILFRTGWQCLRPSRNAY